MLKIYSLGLSPIPKVQTAPITLAYKGELGFSKGRIPVGHENAGKGGAQQSCPLAGDDA
jgi:hypothetical protein